MKTIVSTPKKIEKVVKVVTESVDEIVDADGGPMTMLGNEVYVICTSYAYSGKLTGVNHQFIELSDPYIVFETGPYTDKKWKLAEKLPANKCSVFVAQIENIMALKR